MLEINFKFMRYLLVLATLSIFPSSANAGCGACYACQACVMVTVKAAKQASVAAFNALDNAISTLERTFSYSLGLTSVAFVNNGLMLSSHIQAASGNITTQLQVNSTAESQLWDALNAHEEIRTQQGSMLQQKRYLEDTYNPDTLTQNVKQSFASQDTISSKEYKAFIEEHQDIYPSILRGPRTDLLNTFVLDDGLVESKSLLWGGEIETADEAAAVVFLTQQILFGGDADPFRDLLDLQSTSASMTRDELEMTDKVVWASRLKPAINFFSFDHSLRTRPNAEDVSLMQWMEESVLEGLYDAEGVMQTYSQASEADLYRALAVEQKKQNLIRFMNVKLNQLMGQLRSSRLALQTDSDQRAIRYRTARDDIYFTQ